MPCATRLMGPDLAALPSPPTAVLPSPAPFGPHKLHHPHRPPSHSRHPRRCRPERPNQGLAGGLCQAHLHPWVSKHVKRALRQAVPSDAPGAPPLALPWPTSIRNTRPCCTSPCWCLRSIRPCHCAHACAPPPTHRTPHPCVHRTHTRARTVTFEGQFASTDHYATSVSLLTTYDSNVGQNGISTGSPGQLSSWTTYSPAWTSSPAYGNGIFGAERAAWTFTASPNSAKPG